MTTYSSLVRELKSKGKVHMEMPVRLYSSPLLLSFMKGRGDDQLIVSLYHKFSKCAVGISLPHGEFMRTIRTVDASEASKLIESYVNGILPQLQRNVARQHNLMLHCMMHYKDEQSFNMLCQQYQEIVKETWNARLQMKKTGATMTPDMCKMVIKAAFEGALT